MPPPSLLSSTIASVSAEPARGEQPADVVGERDVADQQHGRPRPVGGDAERGRDRAVDAVGAAVGEHPRRCVAAGGEERLDVAHRHRGGDDERRLGRQAHAELCGDARLGQPVAASPRSRPPRSGRRASTPRARRGPCAAAPAPARAGRRSRSWRPRRAGSCHACLGVERDLQRAVEPVQPLAQRLGGREVADAQDEVGRVRGGEAGVAQQRVVVRDGGGAAAGARERVGEQRQRERVRKPGERRAEPGVALAAPGDDDAARLRVERGAQPVEQRRRRRELRARAASPTAGRRRARRRRAPRRAAARRARAARAARS